MFYNIIGNLFGGNLGWLAELKNEKKGEMSKGESDKHLSNGNEIYN